jgi:hypothetical protein
MYACMCVYMHVCMYDISSSPASQLGCVCGYFVFAFTNVHIHAHIYTNALKHVWVFKHRYTNLRTHTTVHTHTFHHTQGLCLTRTRSATTMYVCVTHTGPYAPACVYTNMSALLGSGTYMRVGICVY